MGVGDRAASLSGWVAVTLAVLAAGAANTPAANDGEHLKAMREYMERNPPDYYIPYIGNPEHIELPDSVAETMSYINAKLDACAECWPSISFGPHEDDSTFREIVVSSCDFATRGGDYWTLDHRSLIRLDE